MRDNRNSDPGKNNAFIQMIRQAEELWNEYKGLDYMTNKEVKRQIIKLEKAVEKLQSIDWKTEFELLKKLYE